MASFAISPNFQTFKLRKVSNNRRAASIPCHASNYEVRVCTNKTCSLQGSKQILQFAKDLALPGIQVTECGCLANCGNGPNVAILPGDADAMPVVLHHLTTPSRMGEALTAVCGVPIDNTILKCTELRLAGNSAAMDEDFPKAIQLYTEALELNPPYGKHLMLANRSAARLASTDASGALEDATAAVECCPDEFTTAGVRQADAFFALGKFEESLAALQRAAARHPPYAKTTEYKQLESAIKRSVGTKVKLW